MKILKKKIDSYELSSNSYMQQGTLVGAYSNAVQDAAKNANGAANGFMGIGMMNMASGNVMTGAVTGPWQNAQNGNANNQTITKEQAVDKKILGNVQIVKRSGRKLLLYMWNKKTNRKILS